MTKKFNLSEAMDKWETYNITTVAAEAARSMNLDTNDFNLTEVGRGAAIRGGGRSLV